MADDRNLSAMTWSGLLDLLVRLYADRPDDHALSLGHWDDDVHEVPGRSEPVNLPRFNPQIRLTMGELRACAANR